MTIAEQILNTITRQGYAALTIQYGYLVLPMNTGRVTFPVPVATKETHSKKTEKLMTGEYHYSDNSVLTFNERSTNNRWKVVEHGPSR